MRDVSLVGGAIIVPIRETEFPRRPKMLSVKVGLLLGACSKENSLSKKKYSLQSMSTLGKNIMNQAKVIVVCGLQKRSQLPLEERLFRLFLTQQAYVDQLLIISKLLLL